MFLKRTKKLNNCILTIMAIFGRNKSRLGVMQAKSIKKFTNLKYNKLCIQK